MIEYIDQEEKEIIESLHSDNWISDFNQDIKNSYEETARLTLLNSKKISIDVSEEDFKNIQEKALKQGISSESLITLLVHKFSKGQIAITI